MPLGASVVKYRKAGFNLKRDGRALIINRFDKTGEYFGGRGPEDFSGGLGLLSVTDDLLLQGVGM